MKYQIAIVEDDTEALNRISGIVNGMTEIDIVLTAANFSEAKTFLGNNKPHILLTDLGLPDGDGTDLIRLAFDNDPNCLILVLSALGDEQHVISAIMAGAKGYILKDDDTQEIQQVITQLIAGGSPISAAIARYLLVKLQRPAQEKVASTLLTARESEVLELVALGYRTNEIAEKLFISYHTVVNHIRNVYDKLAVSSRSQAIRKASQLGLLAK